MSNPDHRVFQYKLKTATSNLRPHLWNDHTELYARVAEEKGWNFQSKSRLSQARSAETSAAATKQRDDFNQDTFHQHLVNLIAVDDQVCFHFLRVLTLISCPKVYQICGLPGV
jgi:hypothetical protein